MSSTAAPREAGGTFAPPGAGLAISPPAVVIGLDSATGLQTARILAARGVPVLGIAADLSHPCCRTNVCEQIFAAHTGNESLIDALLRVGPDLQTMGVLFPCTDLSVLLVSRYRDELETWFHVILPDAEVVEMLVDKETFYAFAQREGLPVPATRILRSHDDVAAAARELQFPCILKPAVKTLRWKSQSKAKAYRVSSATELATLYQRLSPWTASLVVQEWIEGGDTEHYTCNCYFSRASEPLASVTTRKLRQWPPTGGEGCLSVECSNEVVRDETVRLFQKVNHRGLGYLEMKRDTRTGRYLIIEPNIGRPTGRSASAEAAGVELLLTKYRDALGWPLPAESELRTPSVKWIHYRRDFQAAASQWWRGDLTLQNWIASLRGPKVDALFSWRDPLPFLADLARAAGAALPRRKHPRDSGRSEMAEARE